MCCEDTNPRLVLVEWEREFQLPSREAGPPHNHDDEVDSDQQVVNKELSVPLKWE